MTAIEAYEHLEDMQDILRALAHYREARTQVIHLTYDVRLQLDKLELEWWPLTDKRARWIRKLSRRVHQLDAVLRPLG